MKFEEFNEVEQDLQERIEEINFRSISNVKGISVEELKRRKKNLWRDRYKVYREELKAGKTSYTWKVWKYYDQKEHPVLWTWF